MAFNAGMTKRTRILIGLVAAISMAEAKANISVLCIIAHQQVVLCARENLSGTFLEIRRVE